MYVCVCVSEREREREKRRSGEVRETGKRKVMHMCIGMQEGERERNVCVRVCVFVSLCVVQEKQ